VAVQAAGAQEKVSYVVLLKEPVTFENRRLRKVESRAKETSALMERGRAPSCSVKKESRLAHDETWDSLSLHAQKEEKHAEHAAT